MNPKRVVHTFRVPKRHIVYIKLVINKFYTREKRERVYYVFSNR